MTWGEALKSTRHRWALVFCAVMLTLIVNFMPTYYLKVIQPKAGFIPGDLLLDLLSPMDLSLPVFSILYLVAIHTIATAFRKPEMFVVGLTTYTVLSLVRPLTMYLVTFEPPPGMILLVDPVTSYLVYPDNTFAKDLFFSGHVSTMMVMVLIEQNRIIRLVKILSTAVVGLLLAWQHVHYTIDLLVAPVITYLVFRGVSGLLKVNNIAAP